MNIVLFDGVCNLCNKTVLFLIKQDKNNHLHFAAMQTIAGESIIKKHALPLPVISKNQNIDQYSASAQFDVIPNDSSWSWTLLQINPTISGSKDGNIIPLSTNDIIVAQQNTVRITSDGGKQWQTKTLPESFSIPGYLDNNRICVFAVRPAPSTIFLIADRR